MSGLFVCPPYYISFIILTFCILAYISLYSLNTINFTLYNLKACNSKIRPCIDIWQYMTYSINIIWSVYCKNWKEHPTHKTRLPQVAAILLLQSFYKCHMTLSEDYFCIKLLENLQKIEVVFWEFLFWFLTPIFLLRVGGIKSVTLKISDRNFLRICSKLWANFMNFYTENICRKISQR